MRELLTAALVIVAIGVAATIGAGMIDKTENVTLTIAPGSTLVSDVADDSGEMLITMTSLMPLAVLALIGGVALFYVVGYLRQGGI